MLLKKQTVWLLTMLSLVVVLSVYYLTSPGKTQSDMAAVEQKGDKQTVEKDKAKAPVAKKSTKSGSAAVSIASGDDDFEAMRMEMEDERSQLRDQNTTIMGNTELSAEERNKAYEANKEIGDEKVKEGILEKLISGTMNYDDALVRIDGKDVNVTVKADKLSQKEANEIIRTVEKEVGDAQNVAVEFQPKK
ncbi:stage III sporulation protein AH [Bacillus sp. OV322]|uniref:SpoIIIAH-like family protein n=1 Tax=unclassified Bacillus (in: firmicutes) TaxID=185979 RepID=UPI0008E440FC|nr:MULTISPECIES: SpoIIIAH-like family protein [unclassified Bacillus (in: firmicutes)]OIK10140.1 stage III sporulation protein AH [Bacillus sp. MUM 13]SFC41636.1 stage III sporulation protein AH [Bacillus sp. OV322]